MTAKTTAWVTQAAYFGLLGLWIAWATVLAPPRHAPASLVLTASTLPLLLWLRALLHDRRGAYLGLGLFSLGYFIHGVGALAAGDAAGPASMEVILAAALFYGCLARLKRSADA